MNHHRPLTDEERAAIEAREKAATAGPWDLTKDRRGERWPDRPSIRYTINDDGIHIEERDASFITHARTDIPRLLESEAYWREQTALVAKGIDEWHSTDIAEFKATMAGVIANEAFERAAKRLEELADCKQLTKDGTRRDWVTLSEAAAEIRKLSQQNA